MTNSTFETSTPGGPRPRTRFLLRWVPFLALLLVALLLTQRLADERDLRLDLTDAQLHTLSPETKALLAKIDDRVAITYYASERVPAGFQNLRHDTIDMLAELERASGGRVEVRVIDPYTLIEEHVSEKRAEYETGETEDPVEGEQTEATSAALETEAERRERMWGQEKREELSARGISELQGPSVGDGSFGYVWFYSAIELRYLDRTAEVIPRHSSLTGLEYELASRIARLTATGKPRIAFFLGKPSDRMQIPASPTDPGAGGREVHVYEYLTQGLSSRYDVVEVSLDGDAARIPSDAKLLIVAEPDQLTERQRYEIDRSIAQGRPALFLVSTVTGDLRQQEGPFGKLDPSLDPLFERWGVSIGRELISSIESGSIEQVRRGPDGRPVMAPVAFPLAPLVSGPGLNSENPMTVGLGSLIFPFASAFRPNDLVLERSGLTFTPLATTDEISWNSAFRPQLIQSMLRPPGDPARRQKFIVAALLEGTFPTAYPSGDPIPRWASELEAVDGDVSQLPPPEIAPEVMASPGRVVLIGSADMAKIVPLQYFRASHNYSFLAGVVESLTLGQDLVNIRAKRPVPRPLAETTAQDRWLATYVNIAGIPLAILILALVRFAVRRAGTRAYETRGDRTQIAPAGDTQERG